ncbi:MAG: hypothetical protein Fur0037_07730 [Planctomycetota bacterium]
MTGEESVDYGPLRALLGTWKGDRGMDTAPEPDGSEENPFFETIAFTPAGGVTNAESQTMVAVRYHQVACRKSDRKVFHDETGYWLYEKATGKVVQVLAIPRGLALIAEGTARESGGGLVLEVRAALEGPGRISQTPFLLDRARTLAFAHRIEVRKDQMTYSETTDLEIYGKSFRHTDENALKKES